jgi:DNA helicase-2/ATP-dependent DNA helicase PcrA
MVQLATELRELRTHAGESALDLIGRVIRTSGIGVEALSRRTTSGTTRFDRLAMLMDLAGSFRNLDGDSSLHAFVAYISDSDRFSQSVEAELPTLNDAVTVMSIHKAKGLEFPIVALPGLIKGKFPSTQAEDYWHTKPYVVPHKYRLVDQHPDVVAYPGEVENIEEDFKAHKTHLQGVNRVDEDRLVYVAVTRAEKLVIASSHWWGPKQTTLRHPSVFLEMLRGFATNDVEWELAPEKGAKNPQIASNAVPMWPARVSDEVISQLQAQANLVVLDDSADESLNSSELSIAQSWDSDIDALLKQVSIAQSNERTVRLPRSLSASQVMQLQQDQQAFLRTLVRPMPRQPSAAADRGTAFHAWVENFYGQRGLFDIDTLPGSSDTEIYSDDDLGKLKAAFTSGVFAARAHHALETPFALVVGARTWRGRIDAVFAGSLEDPTDSMRWTVIDWKTGAPGTANPLQLHIYRNAWAQIMGVDVANVDAAFYFVGDGVIESLSDVLDIDGLSNLI